MHGREEAFLKFLSASMFMLLICITTHVSTAGSLLKKKKKDSNANDERT